MRLVVRPIRAAAAHHQPHDGARVDFTSEVSCAVVGCLLLYFAVMLLWLRFSELRLRIISHMMKPVF
jgi:hypothetical protein